MILSLLERDIWSLIVIRYLGLIRNPLIFISHDVMTNSYIHIIIFSGSSFKYLLMPSSKTSFLLLIIIKVKASSS